MPTRNVDTAKRAPLSPNFHLLEPLPPPPGPGNPATAVWLPALCCHPGVSVLGVVCNSSSTGAATPSHRRSAVQPNCRVRPGRKKPGTERLPTARPERPTMKTESAAARRGAALTAAGTKGLPAARDTHGVRGLQCELHGAQITPGAAVRRREQSRGSNPSQALLWCTRQAHRGPHPVPGVRDKHSHATVLSLGLKPGKVTTFP